ncbi:MAG TPA: hypothetical protein VLE89_03860 [Chlamydiales bacterium]|nr:hypothetical protein [Chlamydiales bacterium]
MKKWILALSLFLQAAAFAGPYEQLFELFGISPQAMPAEIVAETHRLWAQPSKERWEYDRRFEELRAQLWPLFDELHLLQAQKPQKMHYHYALVVGALLSRVEDRVHFLTDLYKEGIQFDQIVFLTGERPLLDAEQSLTGLKTEREMAEWVYARSDLPKEIPVLFIDAPMKKGSKTTYYLNRIARPGLNDTLFFWLKTNPTPGDALLISSQPYLNYHQAVAEHHLPDPFTVEPAGPAASPTASVALILDTLAKQLSWQNLP